MKIEIEKLKKGTSQKKICDGGKKNRKSEIRKKFFFLIFANENLNEIQIAHEFCDFS